MKKALLLGMALMMWVPSSAWALPGDSAQKVTSWIKGHAFLSPFYFESAVIDYDRNIVAYRQLQDNHFVDLEVLIDGDTSLKETLILTKKRYNPNLNMDERFDKRPWETEKLVDPWSRQNPTAYQLLSNIYDKNLAEDFKQAKLIYSGPEYIEQAPMGYYRYSIKSVGQYPISKWADIKIYQGKKWTYEHFVNMESHNDGPTIYLQLLPVTDALPITATLANNARMYSAYINQQQKMQERMTPAPIEIK